MNLEKYEKKKFQIEMSKRQLKMSQLLLDQFTQALLENLKPITSPLALISQIQRSGGSMLSQLFDGHPELHVHPHELKVGYPKKFNWPPIDLNGDQERWFDILFEDSALEHFRHGYKKMEKYKDTFLFIFLPTLQKEIFLRYLNTISSKTQRDVFDAYMTSYFGAWINNQNHTGDKKYVAAFTPRLAFMEANMESFFDTYPDGRLISVVRDPQNWFPSACRHKSEKYGDIKKALDQWNESARSMVRNKERYGDRVCMITFEDLVQRTEAVMIHLAGFLGIRFDDILLTPTFNGIPIKPNTSFKLESPGIMGSAISRYKTLTTGELEFIQEITGDSYARVLNMATSFP